MVLHEGHFQNLGCISYTRPPNYYSPFNPVSESLQVSYRSAADLKPSPILPLENDQILSFDYDI